MFWFDSILLSFIGILGWNLVILWFFTDHAAAAKNLNILWAIPFYFPVALFVMSKHPPRWVAVFFRVSCVIHLITLLTWPWLPQDLHDSLIPVVILLLLRAFVIQYRISGGKIPLIGKSPV